MTPADTRGGGSIALCRAKNADRCARSKRRSLSGRSCGRSRTPHRGRSEADPAAWLGITPDFERIANRGTRGPLARKIDRPNKRFSGVELIKFFAILDRDLTEEGGKLTPAQKAQRAVISSELKDVIDALYE